jgi:DNA-directed RNA polymerase specialized sigma subunit
MSNNYWDDEEDEVEVPDHQLDGDALVKKLRKAKRADEKRIKELTEQLDEFVKAKREQTVSEVLAKKGVNAKAARLILKDVEDATEESIDSWLRDNGDLIGYTPQAQNEDTQKDLATLRQQDVLTQGGMTPDKAVDMASRLDNVDSMDELIHLLRNS